MLFHDSVPFDEYPFSSRAHNLLRMYFSVRCGIERPTLGDIRREIVAGRLTIPNVRGLGGTTMREFTRGTGAVPPVRGRDGWKFDPYTGLPLPAEAKKEEKP